MKIGFPTICLYFERNEQLESAAMLIGNLNFINMCLDCWESILKQCALDFRLLTLQSISFYFVYFTSICSVCSVFIAKLLLFDAGLAILLSCWRKKSCTCRMNFENFIHTAYKLRFKWLFSCRNCFYKNIRENAT